MDHPLPYEAKPYEELENLLTLPGEKTLLIKRKHIFSTVVPLSILAILSVGVFTSSLFFFDTMLHALYITLISSLLILIVTLNTVAKIFIDWYFHSYIVTTRRILEVCYQPFFSQNVNDVLLDQVRCTEIDVKIHGYINGLINIGDIIITFDRPTHQTEFILHDIKNPRKIGTILGNMLNTPNAVTPSWYDQSNRQYPFSFPKNMFVNNQPLQRV